MSQVGHIFKKDFQHLWPQSLLVLVLIAMFAWMNARSQALTAQYLFSAPMQLLPLLLPIGWWHLVAAVVGQEVLAGEDQFWVTRPYSRLSLVAAKILYIIMFINLPMLIADCVILHGQGFPIMSHVPGLLFKQLVLFALWLFPAMALAAICQNLWQFLGVGLIVVVTYVLPSFLGVLVPASYWQGTEWIRGCMFIAILVAASVIILLCQYRQRRTAVARLLGVCGLALAFTIPHLPSKSALWHWQFARSTLPKPSPSVEIAFDPARARPIGLPSSSSGSVQLYLPLRVTGVPNGAELWLDYVGISIEGQDGLLRANMVQILKTPDGSYWQKTRIDRPVFERLKDQPVTLHVSGYFTLTRNLGTTRLFSQDTLQDVPDWGRCMVQQRQEDWSARCWSPFRRPAIGATQVFGSSSESVSTSFDSSYLYFETGSYSPLPAQAGIAPLVMTSTMNGGGPGTFEVMLTTKIPVARAHSDFEIRSIHLIDYAVR